MDPHDFGYYFITSMTRYVSIGHRLTGWNAVKNRAQQLDLTLSDDAIKTVTQQIKKLADIKPLSVEEVDTLLRNFHSRPVDEKAAAATQAK